MVAFMTQPGFRIRPFTAKERGIERKRFQVCAAFCQ
jgi:hypothetical protein